MKKKAIKGFDENLKCRDFQYEVGKSYEQSGKIEACENGFHCIKPDADPLNVFSYYPPSSNGKRSRYCEVEAFGTIDDSRDDKIACSKIKIGAEIGIPGLIRAHMEWVREHITNENNAEEGQPATAGYSGAATAGDYGAATAGYSGAATAGYSGAATAGNYGAATAGDSGAATAGDSGAATAGDYGAATAGYRGAATSRGSSCVGADGVAIARGNGVKVKGGMGAILVLAEEYDDSYKLKEYKVIVIDDKTYKPDTWYSLKDGDVIETPEDQQSCYCLTNKVRRMVVSIVRFIDSF